MLEILAAAGALLTLEGCPLDGAAPGVHEGVEARARLLRRAALRRLVQRPQHAIPAQALKGPLLKLTAEQQKQWEAVASELVHTIPELGGQINMQTGEIEGGTQALEENISAWEEAGKAAAQTSALEAKRDMLSGIADEIAREQGLLASAQKEMEQHVNDAVVMGTMIAQQLGTEFDGTAESFRAMMDSVEAYGEILCAFYIFRSKATRLHRCSRLVQQSHVDQKYPQTIVYTPFFRPSQSRTNPRHPNNPPLLELHASLEKSAAIDAVLRADCEKSSRSQQHANSS